MLGMAPIAHPQCVDTELTAVESGLTCAAPESVSVAAEALVWVRVDLGDNGYRFCSAVALSPRLVLTTYSCIAYPGDVEPDAPNQTDGARFPFDRQTYYDPAEYAQFCDRSEEWTTIEDGSFRSRLSVPVPAEAIGVGLADAVDRPTIEVEERIVAGSGSRCDESLAVLLLYEELDAVNLPLRLGDSVQVDEPVMISGVVASQRKFSRRDRRARVQRGTGARGDDTLPPRSLLIEASSCYLDRGGPVFAESSGALVALVTWGQSATCAEDGVAGNTVALRLAPFRTLLSQTASSYGQALFAEDQDGSSSSTPACDAPSDGSLPDP